MDNGPHAIDLVRHLFGEIDRITGEATESQAYGVEDTVTLMVRAAQGPVGTVDLSWTTTVPSRTYLEIYGEQGAVLADLHGISYRYGSWADWKRIPNRTGPQEAFSRQIGHFLDVIDGRRLPLVTPEDGLSVQRLIEAAYGGVRASHWGGEAVRA